MMMMMTVTRHSFCAARYYVKRADEQSFPSKSEEIHKFVDAVLMLID